jgi:branched-chain amino acid transport system permease protein
MRFLFKTSYDQDIDLFRHNGQRFWYALLLLALLAAPWWLESYGLSQLSLMLIYSVVGLA